MTDALTWTPDTATLGEMELWDANPKRMSKTRAERLLRSWEEMGQYQTLAIGPNGEVYDGHQRIKTLIAAGYGPDYEVRVLRSNRVLTEQERRRVVAESTVGTIGRLDWDQLASWDYDELADWGFDDEALAGWNDDAANLALMREAEEEEPLDDPGADVDRAEELREKWGVEPGQLWRLGEHRLICGDCTDPEVVARVMGGERAGAIMTDPPYGMRLDTDYSHMPETRIASKTYERVAGDDEDFDARPFILAFDDIREQFWWGGDYYYETLPAGGSWLVWDKRNANSDNLVGNHFEMCWSRQPHRRRMLHHHWSGVNARNQGMQRAHPTEKSVDVLCDILRDYTDTEPVILDLFQGVGTTLIACERLGRRCRAVEIEPKYVAVTLERWHEMTGKTPELVG